MCDYSFNNGLKLWRPHKRCFITCKALLAVAKRHKTLPSHVITTWVLGNTFTLTTGCQTPHNDVIAIWNVLSWLPKRVNREGWREDCKLLLLLLPANFSLETARGFQVHMSWISPGRQLFWEWKGCLQESFIPTQNWITLADNPFTLKQLPATGIQPCISFLKSCLPEDLKSFIRQLTSFIRQTLLLYPLNDLVAHDDYNSVCKDCGHWVKQSCEVLLNNCFVQQPRFCFQLWS